MALVQCGECGNKVSDKAVSCPQCGNPIAARSDIQETGAPLMTTQVTAKKFKLQKIKATLMTLGGLLCFAFQNPLIGIVGGFLFLGGLVWLFVTAMQVWWHHA
ncbi:MAG: hypothetical protein DMF06_14335 [Verrucomicrobia bacterium]|nr:MAG: hypothetical protein DMF06_14335 [Verrucomicrobiota bacterium]